VLSERVSAINVFTITPNPETGVSVSNVFFATIKQFVAILQLMASLGFRR